ncbi:mycothiol transferase [Subtercola sp. RTI3]|uniref:mycothiol transferase n=1 Tax=Subtercola sp. RTI3 TaxID=3048639 RepID=UPI002B2313CA|nr:DinB family protein [Subtercola sp. RTI3]MEA9984643.1 DinB family protein [Subtercola sp. RTI3]
MTRAADILVDGFTRVSESVHRVLNGLTDDELTARVDPGANTIAWLIWHLTRVQDDHLAGVAGTEQLYTASGWYERLGLASSPRATGYGMSAEEVGAVSGFTAGQIGAYFDAVHEQTVGWVRLLEDEQLDRVVDDAYDPPVTLAARLVSVINDATQHVGQAAFVRGSIRRQNG